jgi:hypothetical protein
MAGVALQKIISSSERALMEILKFLINRDSL